MKRIGMLTAAAAALALLAGGCSSSDDEAVALLTGQSLMPAGQPVYLRGEMNDYAVMTSYRLVKRRNGMYCTLAPLRADWAPYRFKFADSAWTAGSNFGFAEPPGVMREGSARMPLNPASRFEELRFYPNSDGVYRFCIQEEEGKFYAVVQRAPDTELTLMDELFLGKKQQRSNTSASDSDFAPAEN